MTTYKIIGQTNGYIANKDAEFKGHTEIVLESSLSLKQAQSKLLDMYNEKYGCERSIANNWGLAVIQSKPYAFGAVKTFDDGTRSFDYDSRSYRIEIEDNEE